MDTAIIPTGVVETHIYKDGSIFSSRILCILQYQFIVRVMKSNIVFACVVLATVCSMAAAGAVGLTLVPNNAVFDSGQNVIFTVNASNIIPIDSTLNVGLYNLSSAGYQGTNITLSSPIIYNALAGYNSIQNALLRPGYSTYLCAAAANSVFDSSSPFSWTSDTNSILFGQIVTSIGHQLGNDQCSATFGGDSPGMAIEGIGLGGLASPTPTAIFNKSVKNAQPTVTESYTLTAMSPVTVIMVAVGGGTGPLSSVSLSHSSSNYCTPVIFLNNTDDSESVYMALCRNLPAGSYGVQTSQEAGTEVSIGVYVFNSNPTMNVGEFSFIANSPSSQTFSYNAVATDEQTHEVFNSTINTITVNPALTVSISSSAASNSLDVGSQNFTLTAMASPGTGDPANYIYRWYYANTTNVLIGGVTGTTENVIPWYPGTYNYIVSTTDNVGYTATSNVLSISVTNGIPAGLVASRNAIDLGQNVIFTANSAGVDYPANYLVFLQNRIAAPSSYYTVDPSNPNAIIFNTPARYQVIGRISNNGRVGYSKPVNITVNNTLSLTQGCQNFGFFPCASRVDVGDTAEFGAVTSFGTGTPPYTETWYLNGNVVVGFPINEIINSLLPVTANMVNTTQNIMLTVTDNAGETSSISFPLAVNSLPVAGSPSLIIPPVIDMGQTVTMAANVVGGISPYCAQWKLNGNPLSMFFGGECNGGPSSITFTANVSRLGLGSNAIVIGGNNLITATVSDNANSFEFGLGLGSNAIVIGGNNLITATVSDNANSFEFEVGVSHTVRKSLINLR